MDNPMSTRLEDDELPRTPPDEDVPARPPPVHGPDPEPVPEKLPGDVPEPERGPTGKPTPMYVRGEATPGSITLPVGSSLDDIERTFIVATLEHFGGDKRRAANALGCSVKTLYNKLHLYRRQLGHVAAAS